MNAAVCECAVRLHAVWQVGRVRAYACRVLKLGSGVFSGRRY
jgi:hypothetical protein